ncbi:hypothetical protein BVRB_2g046310 [Beta vulgaris subsp. vulgaris]|uniref:BAG domain-containing protein n=1 Tax=Beta vulgaris subsp. vulgaris TaxID=3555 RepID=A0A0J8BGS8_BETVV|nr:BAG family molecular chaperone regulator 8, chloroplastic [Beta vulgaris subsp. vulgaris]KMS99262.1 hypothetical protein BVRB_2g046310 [Beta vulgaris subsp. vulgaris]
MSAFHHHPNHHNTTTAYCFCQSQPSPPPLPCHPPLLSPPTTTTTTTTTTTDPFLIASIVAQLLSSPNPQNLYSQHINPTSISQNQRHPHQQSQQFHPHSPFFSLLQRIDALESSLQRFSSSSSSSSRSFSSLRDAAARTIQVHFRAYLVCRSRTLRQLKQLASIKSGLASIKSSLNFHGFVDFDSLSHNAMDLLLKLDSIQSGDKMIKDSKRSVTREIVEFLELVDGACVKRQQVLLTRKMRSMRLVRNDNRSVYESRGFSERNAGSKCRNVDSKEKKLIANLKERVEKIGRMSKLLDEQEVFGDGKLKGFKHVDEEDDDDDTVGQVTSNYRLRNGLNMKKNAQSSNAKKRVCFVQDENLFRVHNNDGNCRSASRMVDVIENSSKETDDEEEEAESDGEGSSQSSEDLRKRRSDEVSARSKCRNVDNEEKKLIANLKERVEKIGKMSKALEEQEVFGDDEVNGFKLVDDEDDDITGQINSNFRLRNGLNIKKNGQSSNAKKRVCFVEDGNVIRTYDNDGNSRSALRVVDVIEDSIKGTHDEEEPQSDGEGSSYSTEDVRKCRRDEVSEEYDNNQDEEFTFSTTAPVKMEPKADFLQKKPGVKIVG